MQQNQHLKWLALIQQPLQNKTQVHSIATNNFSGNKEEIYQSLLPQLKSLLAGEKNLIANLANTTAVLHQHFDWWWTGFYLVDDNELVLGPFQGPVACTRIASGKGVCGTSWKSKETIIVPDVHLFPGHIACSAESNSEIVVPIINNKHEVVAVLDVDSKYKNAFDEMDAKYLKEIVQILAPFFIR